MAMGTMASGDGPKYDERFFLQSADDLPFEEDILRNPYSVKHWLRYIDHKSQSTSESKNDAICMLYERSLKEVPGSYKLWIRYLRFRMKIVGERSILDRMYEETNNAFERSLVFMHKMPRVWIEYVSLLMSQQLITQTRRVFDRALESLPITQHTRLWPLYLKLVQSHRIPETGIRVFKRYLKMQPEDGESFITYLISVGRLDEAAVKLASIVNDESFVSKYAKSRYQLWSQLCDLISTNPDKIHSLNVQAIIREGIHRYTDQQGKLWISLAEYFTRDGLFEKARDVYEEAIETVLTIRDFSQVFDAYAASEEKLVNALMESESDLTEEEETELEMRLARYEHLIERRPLLLNSVALRQNPHNVEEWHKRVALLEGRQIEIVETYNDSVNTINPKEAIGKVWTLWGEFAKFYEANKHLDEARAVFEKATEFNFSKVDDLASIWCEWAEFELRNNNPSGAIRLMERATSVPKSSKGKKGGVSYHDTSESVQKRLHKSLKLWSMYADLEESFGTFKTTRAVYDKIIDLRIATPQIIINYGMFLEDAHYWEESFKAYEKGVDLFKWPHVYDIWNVYLTKFLKRYGGTKLERARDLFEQCLSTCPKNLAKPFYLLYAKLEEEHGLAKHSMAIYDRAARAGTEKKDQFELFNIYIKKASELFGITYTRQIYEIAIAELPDNEAREMCIKFAAMERKLGEIDRARAIYAHSSNFADPRTCAEFWSIWKEFEMKHGNEDTIREMLRIKRSVQATFNTQVNFMSAQMVAASSTDAENSIPNDMSQLEREALTEAVVQGQGRLEREALTEAAVQGQNQLEMDPSEGVLLSRKRETIRFISSGNRLNEESEVRTTNPDEIDLDEDEDDEDENDEDEIAAKRMKIEQKQVPKAVFGDLVPSAGD